MVQRQVPKTAEEHLLVSEVIYRTLAETARDIIAAHDLEGRITFMNKEGLAFFGLSPGDYTSRNVMEFIPEEYHDSTKRKFSERNEAYAESRLLEIELLNARRERVPFEMNTSPILSDGGVSGLISVYRNISERKRLEAELRTRERYAHSLLALSRQLERAKTYDDVLHAVLTEIETIVGYHSAWIFVLSDDRKTADCLVSHGTQRGSAPQTLVIAGDRMMEEIASGREPVVVADARIDDRTDKKIVEHVGNRTIVNVPVYLHHDRLASIGTGTFNDEGVRPPSSKEIQYLEALSNQIAPTLDRIRSEQERLTAEWTLAQNERRFRGLIENATDGIALLGVRQDGLSILTYVSPAITRILGFSVEEALKLDPRVATHPEDVEMVLSTIEDVTQNPDMARTITYRFRHKDGSWRWLESTMSNLVADESEKAVVFNFRDITEKRKTEMEFLRAQRIESIGRMASGIAHDLNNILTPILLALQNLRDTLADPSSRRLTDMLEANVQRAADLMKRILMFTRGVEGRRDLIQVRSVIGEVEQIVRTTFPKNIVLNVFMDNDVHFLDGDMTQLHQVLLNLCMNARDAMTNGGRLTIEAENVFLNEEFAHQNQEAKLGHYVLIKVTDSGTGIPSNILDKIFDPFFTTKDLDKGTGIGLSTVASIVKSHNGFVGVRSEPGKGTQFKVYLPAAKGAVTHAMPIENAAERVQGQGETILIVEDEEPIRMLMAQELVSLNYKVITSPDGSAGLAAFASNNGIDVLITDINMPFLDGVSVIRTIRSIDPKARIIAMSGHHDSDSDAHNAALKIDAFVKKPFRIQELAIAVRTVLQRS